MVDAAIHGLLDQAGVDRVNRAEGRASAVHSLADRVVCLIQERDRAVANLALMRTAHVGVCTLSAERLATIKAMTRDPQPSPQLDGGT
jgi:hypothetical protein